MNPFVFQNPTKLYYGEGQIEQHLAAEVAKYGKKVLLVYGGGSIKRFGLYDKVTGILKEAGATVYELPGVEPNPRLTSVNKGIALCREHGIELILAVGGGSVLDASKAIAIGVPYEGNVYDFFLYKDRPQAALPLGTILTMAATGSEMNGNSVVSDWENQRKQGLGSPLMYPKFSFCDPNNTKTVPLDQTMYGIVDMIAHVLEEYFNHTTNAPLQEEFQEALLRTVMANAKPLLSDLNSYPLRETIMYCGTMALNGMTNMGLRGDWACHGMEHEISAIYDIPHGGGLAILFPRWMEYVVDAGVDKFVRFAVHVFGVNPEGKDKKAVALEGIAKFKEFLASIDAPASLASYQIGDENISVMAEKAVSFGPIGGFKKLEKSDVEAILRNCLQ